MNKPEPHDAAATSAALRASALSYTPEQIGFAPNGADQTVFGVLMEIGYERAVVTVACFFDGATSLYFSGGGGFIGCGEHEKVKVAAKRLVSLANKGADRLPTIGESSLPAVRMVRFHVRTTSGTKTCEAPESDLLEKKNALWPLYYCGQLVITAIRESGLM